MLVLGVETSCDETGLALYRGGVSEPGLLGHALYSQTEIHARYGGVVPELASRDHVRKLLPLLSQLLAETDTTTADLDGVGYTAGPGLVGALLVGSAFGRSLAWGLGVPAVEIHHMEAHLLAPLLEDDPPAFPFLALLVSGGHTLLVDVADIGRYRILGESVDDAAGEAFDKTAKLLGLPYPGGPALAKLAELGDPDRFRFPRPMTDRPGLDFSFSGLKTYALNTWQKLPHDDPASAADVARAFEDAVVDTLAIKCRRAQRQTGRQRLIVAGGVGANRRLRERLRHAMQEAGGQVYYPRPSFCTDNGAMIAYAAYRRLAAGVAPALPAFGVRARWSLESLSLSTESR